MRLHNLRELVAINVSSCSLKRMERISLHPTRPPWSWVISTIHLHWICGHSTPLLDETPKTSAESVEMDFVGKRGR